MATLDRLRSKVATIVSDKGKTVVYSVTTNTYVATTGVNTQTTTAHTVKVTPPKEPETRLVDGVLVKQGDAFVSLADFEIPFTPKTGDEITFDSETWVVIAIEKLYSGELVALWNLQIRK